MVEERVKVNGRVHDARCENAMPKSPCRCRCKGAHHAKRFEDAQAGSRTGIRSIDISMGGEIEKELKNLIGKQYECPCGEICIIGPLAGYGHEMGLKDKFGNGWWVYQECERCGHQMSWWKFKGRVENTPQLEKMIKTPYEAVPPPAPEIENK